MEDKNAPVKRQFDDFITIHDLCHLSIAHYEWFIRSLVVCVLLAAYYLFTTPNIYTREAALLVKQESTGKSADTKQTSDEFNNIGIVQQSTNVNNVQRHLLSLNVIMEVVRRLGIAKGNDVIPAAANIQRRLKAEIVDDKSTIINLKFTDTSPKRAEEVLNSLVQVYNEKWVEDKNKVAANTSRFITARLKLIERDLGHVDDSISSYKSQHQITNLESVSDIYLQQMSQSDAEIMRLSNQRAMAQYISDVLANKGNSHQLLPTNSGVGSSVLESQITQYNSLLLQLSNHLAYTSDQNPLIINQEKELNSLRHNINQSIANHVKTLDIQLQHLQGYSGNASSKISSNPQQAKHLVSVERQQKVKESLYLYLLQKLEENEITMTYTSYNTEIIDMPHGSDEPTSPNKAKVMILAVAIGLLLPVTILFIRETFDNTIRDKEDVEGKTTIPLIGEIPMCSEAGGKRKWPWSKKKSRRKMVVQANSQDITNEAFRVIRSNIEFMTEEGDNHSNIYIVTSNYPGSGKTFVSMNLAAALAIKEKRVLFIDGDLRHASASNIFQCEGHGLSNYLNGKEDDISSLITQHEDYPSLYILPVGTIPPNPTELLSNSRLQSLFDDMKHKFDYVIIDCPPAETLADTNIIQKYADRTLFIMRTGLFERKRLAELEADYQNGKYKHISLVLNYEIPGGRYGYYYHYGYKYGYHYGYSYYHKK